MRGLNMTSVHFAFHHCRVEFKVVNNSFPDFYTAMYSRASGYMAHGVESEMQHRRITWRAFFPQ